MVKQNNNVNKSTSRKPCMMRASNHPAVIAEMRAEKIAKAKAIAEKKLAKAKATAEKKLKKSSTRVKKTGFCMMRAENDYTLLEELKRKKELENCAKGNTTMVCSECKTKSTPLWRKGPKGPKTLCNACGLRLARLEKAAAKEDCGKSNSPAGSSSEKVKHL